MVGNDGKTDTGVEPVHPLPGGTLVLCLVVVAWAITLTRYLWHSVLLSFDTVNNYAHVWYVADRIWDHGQLPLRMPVLGHGQAFAFPYGFLPWATAALMRPLLGDWTVTLWLALGAVGMVIATFTAFPELRRGWWAAAVLLNPAVIQAALFGQLSFAWAATLLLFGIAAWRRGNASRRGGVGGPRPGDPPRGGGAPRGAPGARLVAVRTATPPAARMLRAGRAHRRSRDHPHADLPGVRRRVDPRHRGQLRVHARHSRDSRSSCRCCSRSWHATFVGPSPGSPRSALRC